MKAIAEFLKTTLIGGLLILVPIYLTALLVVKATAGLIALLEPVTMLLPEALHHAREVVAVAMLVVACFVLGLIARTSPGRRLLEAFERRVLDKIPGFAVLRNITRRVSVEAGDDATFQPAFVDMQDALTPGFIVEELDDDRYVVFVPSVPTPAAGSLYVVPRIRVHRVDVSVAEAASAIAHFGAGTGKLVKSMRPPRLAPGEPRRD